MNGKRIRSLGLVIALCLLGLAPLLWFSLPVFGIRCHLLWGSDRYHRQLGEACMTLLQEHPLGTNAFTAISTGDTDRVPACLRDLHVTSAIRESNRLVLMIGGGPVEFHLEWYPVKEEQWQLDFVDGNNQHTLLYRGLINEPANQASDATSEPASGAASSSHQD